MCIVSITWLRVNRAHTNVTKPMENHFLLVNCIEAQESLHAPGQITVLCKLVGTLKVLASSTCSNYSGTGLESRVLLVPP